MSGNETKREARIRETLQRYNEPQHIWWIGAKTVVCVAPDFTPVLSREFAWQPEQQAFSYMEALSLCDLTETALADFSIPQDALEGRLFQDNAECRWMVLERSNPLKLRLWLLREQAAPSDDDSWHWTAVSRLWREPMEKPPNDPKYYLIGRGTEDAWTFRESRYGSRRFHYPVGNARGSGLDADRRAFVRVREYEALPPDFGALALSGAEPLSAEQLMAVNEAMDAPLLHAHRFVAVGSDQGKTDG